MFLVAHGQPGRRWVSERDEAARPGQRTGLRVWGRRAVL
jgi:hypothetical protein